MLGIDSMSYYLHGNLNLNYIASAKALTLSLF